MIIDPWGEVLAETTARGAEVLMATIDLVEVDEVRQEIDTLHLRRPTLYNGVVRRA
jgi:predicted amidohydrolase